jgi:hypothetical protein
VKAFEKLTEEEKDLMLKTPVLVCILIAGADGEIDRNEIKQAISIVSKNKDRKTLLSEYFAEVSSDFEDKLKVILQSYPYESTQRNPLIEHELSRVNLIWPKLSKDFAENFYNMLLELALKVASSSGGWLGFRSVDNQEARYVKLPMLSKPSKI